MRRRPFLIAFAALPVAAVACAHPRPYATGGVIASGSQAAVLRDYCVTPAYRAGLMSAGEVRIHVLGTADAGAIVRQLMREYRSSATTWV